MTDGWTDQRLAEAERLYQDGHSASQIAKAIGGKLTRSAVIGKIYRRGLKRSPAALKATFESAHKVANGTTGGRRRAPPPPPAPPKETTLAKEIPHDGPVVDLLDLEKGQCKWPFGTPGRIGFGFCGKPQTDGRVYCLDHCVRAYQPLPPKGKRPATVPDLTRLARQYASG